MTALAQEIEPFMVKVDQFCSGDQRLSSLAGAILAGIHFDVAHDSRGFSKALGVEHALVLREVQALVDIERLQVTKRDERTQRCSYRETSA